MRNARYLSAFLIDQLLALAAIIYGTVFLGHFMCLPELRWPAIIVLSVLLDYSGIGRRIFGIRLNFQSNGKVFVVLSFLIRQIPLFLIILLNDFLGSQAIDIRHWNISDVPINENNRLLLDEMERLLRLSDSFLKSINLTFLWMVFVLETLSILQTGRRFLDPWAGVTPTPRKPTPAPTLNPQPTA